jgi:pyruvate kinase
MDRLKYTKIIATVGPATATVEAMRALIRAGADCFRINFSHGEAVTLQPLIDAARNAARAEQRHVTLLADIQGPKLRIGRLPLQGVTLTEGEPFLLTPREVEGTDHQVQSQYPLLARDLERGARVLFADGAVELVVERIEDADVHCKVIAGGRLFSNKGLNLPGRRLSVETLTEKDRRDLAFLGTSDIDIVAISFVRSAADLALARKYLGKHRLPVMAKLERPEALVDLDSILEAADGIMIARGDLGVEMPFEEVPVLQKQILERAAQRGKWAVVATQMLGSMVVSRRPTRAEASDVVNAVIDGADAVMMSEETAVGEHPTLAVAAMSALTAAGERHDHQRGEGGRRELAEDIATFASGAAGAAVAAAERLRARAIVTLAGSGLTALAVSKHRPRLPILALGSWQPTLNRLNVLRGVTPLAVGDSKDVEEQLEVADQYLLQAGWATAGETVVVAAALPLGTGKDTNTIRFHRVRTAGTPRSVVPSPPQPR